MVFPNGSAIPTSGTLEFVTAGDVLSLYLNGNQIFSAVDSSITGPGSVGIRSTAGATVTSFSATATP